MTSRSIPRQLATFAAVLLVLYAGGIAAGHLIGDDEPGGHGTSEGSHATPSETHGGAPAEVRGLTGAAGGLRLSVDASEIRAGRSHDLTFAVLEEDGAPVLDYDTTHTKKMHLIVVRRDTTGFQHLHPTQDEAGLWHARTRFAQGGRHRVLADFSHDGEQLTLAGDITVRGAGRDRTLPEPSPVARTAGGYSVRIDAAGAPAGEPTELSFVVRDSSGGTVATQPYLGAGGHLVALRERDLAFLHVHPNDHAGDAISFETTFPSAATYRLFLQFRVGGRVRTAAFTQQVDEP